MSVLSAHELQRRIWPPDDPFAPNRIFVVPTPLPASIHNPSVDLCLGNHFIVTRSVRFSVLDACEEATEKTVSSYQERVFVPFGDKLVIHPGTFILGVTWQYIGLPSDVQAQVLARSTWGRAGLTVATAVVVHSGFLGTLTLELVNHGSAPVALYPGARVAQMVFQKVENGTAAGALSKYAGQTEPAFTRMHEEREELKQWAQIGEKVAFRKATELPEG